jgi:hypothetical protein
MNSCGEARGKTRCKALSSSRYTGQTETASQTKVFDSTTDVAAVEFDPQLLHGLTTVPGLLPPAFAMDKSHGIFSS